jgi:hypothetical protein
MLDKVAAQYSYSDMIVFPTRYFCPTTPFELDIGKRREQANRSEAYAVHHFSGSWYPMRLKVFRHAFLWTISPAGLVVVLVLLILLAYLLPKASL